MTEINIDDTDLQGLDGKVLVLTGGSAGIGLETTTLLLSLGAKVVNGDLKSPSRDLESANYQFVKTDVTNWTDLKALFKKAVESYGRVDHVFANAGIAPTTSYLQLALDDEGEPLEPTSQTLDINLKAVVNTTALALHFMQKHEGECSIVLMASISCCTRFSGADYAMAKHGVLGLTRSLYSITYPRLPIRVNALAPSWTVSEMVPLEAYDGTGAVLQGPEAPARGAVFLMAGKMHGQVILVGAGKYREIDEAVLLKAMTKEITGQEVDGDDVLAGVQANFEKMIAAAGGP